MKSEQLLKGVLAVEERLRKRGDITLALFIASGAKKEGDPSLLGLSSLVLKRRLALRGISYENEKRPTLKLLV